MRSPTSPAALEAGARVIALGALVWLIARAWMPAPEVEREIAASADIPGALSRWTKDPRSLDLSLRLDQVPAAAERDWLAGLAKAGSSISWQGDLDPFALEVATSAEPVHSYLITATGAPGMELRFSDALREIAVIPQRSGAVSLRTSTLAGPVALALPSGDALALAPPPPRLGRVAVIGAAGWEAKFVVAALEERGWRVDASIAVAPGVHVGRFDAVTLDTSRHSAIVVLDEPSLRRVPQLAGFIRSGGGVILAGTATRAPAIADLSPVLAARTVSPTDTAIVTQDALGGAVFSSLRPGAAVIESRGDLPIVVGMRVGAGRMVAVGYANSWRWRMAGDEDAPEAHRQWWSALVGSVAYAPDTAAARAAGQAPLAALVSALGPARSASVSPGGRRWPIDQLLFAVAAVALIGEIVSRRRRGLR